MDVISLVLGILIGSLSVFVFIFISFMVSYKKHSDIEINDELVKNLWNEYLKKMDEMNDK